MILSYGENRRRYRRVKVQVKVSLSKTTSEMAFVYGHTKDLSLGGACIELNQNIPSFSLIKIHLESEDGLKSVEVEGRVLWIKECRDKETDEIRCYIGGIQFLNLHTEDRKQIVRDLMEKNR